MIWEVIIVSILSSSVVSVIVSKIYDYLIYRKQIKSSLESILMGLAGEIDAIKGVLEKNLRNAKKFERDSHVLRKYSFYYPREYFDIVLSEIGKLDDKTLVRQIIYGYSLVVRLKEYAQNIDEEIYDKTLTLHKHYREELEMTFKNFVLLFLKLKPYIDKHPAKKWETSYPEWYKRDVELLDEEPSYFNKKK